MGKGGGCWVRLCCKRGADKALSILKLSPVTLTPQLAHDRRGCMEGSQVVWPRPVASISVQMMQRRWRVLAQRSHNTFLI